MNRIIGMTVAWALAVMLATVAVVTAERTPAQAQDVEPEWTWRVAPRDWTNRQALREMQREKLQELFAACMAEYNAALDAEEESCCEPYYETYYEPVYYAPSYVQGDPDGLNSFVGVVDGPNGTIETAYSSNVLYHYRTQEWTPDEYGFYRTEDGYYVVASNEYEEGTVIETSRGEAMVLDGGCAEGYIDFYTNW